MVIFAVSPFRGRGLKSRLHLLNMVWLGVALPRAGIEIAVAGVAVTFLTVSPFRGRGLKYHNPQSQPLRIGCRPSEGGD